jgi:lysophospholipase L1-like esterase
MPQTRIFLSGDSSTYGYGDSVLGGWGNRLKTHMMQRAAEGEIPAREIVNFAVSQQSLDQIALRFPGQVSNFLRVKSLGVFMVGAVDSVVRRGHDRSRLPLPEFTSALHRLSEICVANEVSPIFLGYHDVDEQRTVPWKNGDRFINANIRAYNDVVRQHAAEIGAPYVEPTMNLHPYDEVLADDGLHPSSRGAQLICDSSVPHIDTVLTAQSAN